jgi:hypothetical protein
MFIMVGMKLVLRFRCTDCVELVPEGSDSLLYVFNEGDIYACGVLCEQCQEEIPKDVYVDFLKKSFAWVSTKNITAVEDLFRLKREEFSKVPHDVSRILFREFLHEGVPLV